jgi:hypothetical protein
MPKHAHVMFLNVEGEDVLIYDKNDSGQQIVVRQWKEQSRWVR